MDEKKSINKTFTRVITKVIRKSAERSANTACYFWNHQPVVPDAVKNSVSFNDEKFGSKLTDILFHVFLLWHQ